MLLPFLQIYIILLRNSRNLRDSVHGVGLEACTWGEGSERERFSGPRSLQVMLMLPADSSQNGFFIRRNSLGDKPTPVM